MFQILSLALIASLPAGSVPCSEKETLADPDNWHLSDVCANYLENGGETPTYSATFLASLNPQPASQQVLIFAGTINGICGLPGIFGAQADP